MNSGAFTPGSSFSFFSCSLHDVVVGGDTFICKTHLVTLLLLNPLKRIRLLILDLAFSFF